MDVKDVVCIKKLKDMVEETLDGFPYLLLDNHNIYIPKDRKVWLEYGIKGSIVSGARNYIIKKGSDNIVYLVLFYINPLHNIKITNINIDVDGKLIKEMNFDAQWFIDPRPVIIRLIEVSPDSSTVKAEFDVNGEDFDNKHIAILYTKDGIDIK